MNTFDLADYSFPLPEECIAQHPAAQRETSRLFCLHCNDSPSQHLRFADITTLLRPGDLLVVNNSKVFPARLLGWKETGGKVELLLLQYPATISECTLGDGSIRRSARAQGLVRSSKRPRAGSALYFSPELQAEILDCREDGKVSVLLHCLLSPGQDLDNLLERHGEIPLPPYIRRARGSTNEDRERYQTSYAKHTGSVAAPTAGLHFSQTLLDMVQKAGAGIAALTLHVGYGTFAPVRQRDIRQHVIHKEQLQISEETADQINASRRGGGRIWAIGTTSARALEFAGGQGGVVYPVNGPCSLYIYPGYRFRVVDNLVTNFHLPESSLLFLVSALAGRERILAAYKEAIALGYRFFSYGDAMAILCKP